MKLVLKTDGALEVPELNIVTVKNVRFIADKPYKGISVFRFMPYGNTALEICSYLGYGSLLNGQGSDMIMDTTDAVVFLNNGNLASSGDGSSIAGAVDVACTIN